MQDHICDSCSCPAHGSKDGIHSHLQQTHVKKTTGHVACAGIARTKHNGNTTWAMTCCLVPFPFSRPCILLHVAGTRIAEVVHANVVFVHVAYRSHTRARHKVPQQSHTNAFLMLALLVPTSLGRATHTAASNAKADTREVIY